MVNNGKTFVVGSDSSHESLAALRWARSVADHDDRILVVNAWDIPITVGAEMTVVIEQVDIEAATRQMLDELIAREGDDRLEAMPYRGHAGRALVEVGASADVIVVGHRGHGRMSMMLGSTANYVIHHTDRAVVVVRGEDRGAPKQVVVGVDHFDGCDDNPSVRALRWAINVPGVEHVVALHGWFLPPLAVGVYPEQAWDIADMDESARQVAEHVVEAAGPAPAGVSVVAEPARGTGAFALIEASRRADLVVVGRRGRGGFAELLLGSTSAALAAHGHCPIAIIR